MNNNAYDENTTKGHIMENDKVLMGALGTAFGAGLVIGWKASRRHIIKKVDHTFEVAGLQSELLVYMLNTLSDDDFDPQEFETTVNHKVEFIMAVAEM